MNQQYFIHKKKQFHVNYLNSSHFIVPKLRKNKTDRTSSSTTPPTVTPRPSEMLRHLLLLVILSLVIQPTSSSSSSASLSPFAVLDVPPSASLTTCKKKYLRLATEHHPDKGGSVQEFRKIKQAYDDIKALKIANEECYGTKRERRKGRRSRRRRKVKKPKNVGSYDLKDLFESFKH